MSGPDHATSLAASTRLADAEPPIALGALDGRYRGVVAPLVDHLSEAALNRARVHVEVEWLIHLTEHERRAGRAPPHRRRAGSRCATWSPTSAPPRSTSWPRPSGSPRTTSRPSSTSSRSGSARSRPAAGRRPRRADPLRLHQRGRQQPLVRPHGQGRRARGVAAPRRRARRRSSPTMASRPARRAAARAHPRPARHPDDDGQGARRARRAGCSASSRRIEDAEYLGKLNGATGTYGAHVAAVPERRLAGASAARSSRASASPGTR